MHFDGIGWVSMRNKWEKNATFALFHSGNFYFGHQHLDQNSFIIFKNTPLAIDSGIYNLGTPNYKWATRFHNTILVGDPGPMNSLNDGEAGQTGASPMYFIQNPQKSKSNKGDIILFENHPNYTYTIGDASKAYYPSRLSAFIRKFFFLKPNSFFIFDQIVLPTDHYPIRWLFQSEKMPLISEKLIQVTNGNGHLICKTLLPEKVEISVNTVSFGQTRYGGINYRTEIIPVKRESEEIFLTALWTTDLDPVKIPPFHIIKSQSQNLVGCLISDQLVLFSKNSSAQKREAYFVPMEDSTKLESFIIDLVPKGTYDIYQNGKHILRKASSPGGILQFQTKGGGQFELFLNEVK
jgi:hypothetical protein